MSSLEITLDQVKEARSYLKDHVIHTVMSKAKCLPGIYFKCENFQRTGSFKIRGALNKIRSLNDDEKKQGVIAASAGNHAQGVALSAKLFNVKATIVMPEVAPLMKVQNTRDYGAEVVLSGAYFDQSYDKACEIAKEKKLVFVHPYKDSKVITGQGTIGLELLEDLPNIDQVVVPIGGGGLISGIAFVIKNLKPDCEVVGVVSQEAPGMKQLKVGEVVTKPKRVNTIADGIAVKNPSQEMYDTYISKYVDKIVAVSDDEIAEAIVNLMEKDKMIAEGSGAAGVAAVLAGKIKPKNNSCVLVCGGNIDLNTVHSVIETGLRRKGRLTRVTVIVDDLPGSLARVTRLVAKCGANILDVMHDRVSSELALRETRIDFLLETTGFEHIKKIESILQEEGIRILKGNLHT